jgi:hypothetical protein
LKSLTRGTAGSGVAHALSMKAESRTIVRFIVASLSLHFDPAP